ncbi:SRPBCC domain-containing protein [Sphingobacterium griseoflavum]|uniref:Polyketide cyclase n=1 Tax=Sphingobacterium griseoflavum TaxID=1474952 RepID=A0ABQ3HR72_9SPHI|nr:SRPBCC domain-containing protein [Sphingobacterium griseoflavum]GHE23706.1 hypothetical protein GCM10017764_06740 [Sphingobacterium griseoflavum]
MGKIHIEQQIEIQATIDQVWSVFTDFQAYEAWSPTIHFLSDPPKEGRSVKVRLLQPDGKQITMQPQVLRLSPAKELRWRGRLFLPGVFDGEHYFILKSLPDGSTQFIQGEHFSGVLVPLLKKMILGPTVAGFIAFNKSLKERVEAKR